MHDGSPVLRTSIVDVKIPPTPHAFKNGLTSFITTLPPDGFDLDLRIFFEILTPADHFHYHSSRSRTLPRPPFGYVV